MIDINKDIDFIMEIEKMKTIKRRSRHIYDDDFENDAEHSWHIALMAIIMRDYIDEEIDLLKVIKILLIHDLVEIYAGDTFCYDKVATSDKYEREKQSASKLFSKLNKDKESELWSLWCEFENKETLEAKFANAMDRLQPILLNYYNNGGTWKEYSISRSQVEKRAAAINDVSARLGKIVNKILDDSEKKGYFKID